MDRYDISPLLGIGPVHLGMTRSQARAVMPGEPRPTRKYGGSVIDTWHASAFQVFYDDDEKVEFIELSRGEFQAVLYGVDVFRSKAAALVQHLDKKHHYDRSQTEDGHSFVFPDPELALWRQAVPEPGEPEEGDNGGRFDTLGIGIRGYYSAESL